jgi:hypothetical protein
MRHLHRAQIRNRFGFCELFRSETVLGFVDCSVVLFLYLAIYVVRTMPEGSPETAALRPLFFSHAKVLNKGSMTSEEYARYIEAENVRHSKDVDAR